MHESKKILGVALALGITAPAHADFLEKGAVGTKAHLELAADQAYREWHNCTLRAEIGKKVGTIDAIYAGEKECGNEWKAVDSAVNKLQDWQFGRNPK